MARDGLDRFGRNTGRSHLCGAGATGDILNAHGCHQPLKTAAHIAVIQRSAGLGRYKSVASHGQSFRYNAVDGVWQNVEDDILQDVARRIKAMDKLDPLTPTAAWNRCRLCARMSPLRWPNTATGAGTESGSCFWTRGWNPWPQMMKSYRAAGLTPSTVQDSEPLNNLLNARYRQTLGTWQNLTATMAVSVTGAFESWLDRAWLQVSSGAFDYNTAIRSAVDDLADHMPGVTYPSGHTDTLEVAVRWAVLTGANQTAAKLQLARAKEMSCEFVEVTAHEGPARNTPSGKARSTTSAERSCTRAYGMRTLRLPLDTVPARGCAAGTAGTIFIRSSLGSRCPIILRPAWRS